MHIKHINAVYSQALKRGLKRAHHTIIAIIEHFAPRGHIKPFPEPIPRLWRCDLHQPPNLGRDHIVFARFTPQKMVDPRLREAKPIKRCSIEIPQPCIPRILQGVLRILLRDRAIEIAQRGRAKPELAQPQPAISKAIPVAKFDHSAPSKV